MAEAYQCLKFIYPPGLWPSIQKMIADASQPKVGRVGSSNGRGISGLVVYHAPGSDENRYFSIQLLLCNDFSCSSKYRRTGLGSKLHTLLI